LKLTDKLDFLLESKQISRMEFSKQSGIPYMTIVNFYEKGTENVKLSTLKKIARYFDVSLDYIADDRIKDINYGKIHSFPIDNSEIQRIKKFRMLDEHGKEAVDSILDIEYKRYEQAKEKAQSEDAVKIMYIQYNDQKASAGEGFTLDYEYMQRWGVQYNELTKKADFCVDVEGDSMEPRFYDGDTLLIRRQPAVDVGEIGLFILDEKGYVKKWGGDRLISLNPAYEDIEIEENSRLDCAGKVLGVLDPDWIIET